MLQFGIDEIDDKLYYFIAINLVNKLETVVEITVFYILDKKIYNVFNEFIFYDNFDGNWKRIVMIALLRWSMWSEIALILYFLTKFDTMSQLKETYHDRNLDS